MDHTEATREMIAERYLLGELSSAQKDAFEEHYFSCAQCAEAVTQGAHFVDNARAVLAERPTTVPAAVLSSQRGKWLPAWFPTAAAAVFASVTVYHSLVLIPRLERGARLAADFRPLTSISLQSAASRTGALPEYAASPSESFGVYADIPAAPDAERYLCTIQSGGEVKMSTAVSPEQARNTLHLLVPAGKLEPGDHELVIVAITSNGENREMIRYPFRLRSR